MAKTIRVVATLRGFDGVSIREPGEEFTMPADTMTAKKEPDGKVIAPTWFKPIGSAARETADEDGLA
jgi:hypothetical protein